MEKVKIRSYRDSDYLDVKRNLQEGGLYNKDCDKRERLRKKVQKDPNSIIVAIVDGKVVGNVYIVAEPWCAFIFRLAVRKKYGKQGIGSLLLEEAEKMLRKTGVKWVSVFVEDAKEDLKGYYSKRGYEAAKKYRCMDKNLKDI